MNPFYIYALKDPRQTPAKPFYIGKGTGTRAWDHVLKADATRKGKRIGEIQSEGRAVLTVILADELTETQALKLEAELISAFGTEQTGGFLTNTVVPTGSKSKARKGVIVASGIIEKAQIGLALLKGAVLELAQANPGGITNSEASQTLGLQSDYAGGSKDYLTWSVLGLLMREGKLTRGENRRHHAAVR